MEDQPDSLGLFLCFKSQNDPQLIRELFASVKDPCCVKDKELLVWEIFFSILNYSIDLHHDLCDLQTSFSQPLSFWNSDNSTYLPHGTVVDLHNSESATYQRYISKKRKKRLSLGTFQIKPDGADEKMKDQNNTLLAHKGMVKIINVIISSSPPSVQMYKRSQDTDL